VTGGLESTGSGVRARVNGVDVEVPTGTTLADLVARSCPSDRGVAVAVDRTVVPRSRWAEVVVAEGCSVEMVTAAAGG
jgi:sulfur carrier protein